MEKLSYVIFHGLCLLHLVYELSATAQQDFVNNLLNSSRYNKMERPGFNEGIPTTVDIDVFVSGMNSISEITMNYHINMFLRQRWQDKRLSFRDNPVFNATTLTLSYEYIHKMWQPDTFLKNEVTKGSFHDITVPNILINLDPDGRILYSQRISTKLSCNMKLQKYPLDNQTCYIEMESYGYKTTEMLLRWYNVDNPIQVNDRLELPEFNLTTYKTGQCTVHYTTGAFSCIHAALHFDRLRSYYIIQVYIPTILIVMLSWVSFWIDHQAVPARISLGLLTVLTITTQASSISSKLPKVSYIKAIDVWMFTCTVFVFAALIEYSIVNVLARKKSIIDKERKKDKEETTKLKANGVPTAEEGTTIFHQLYTDKALLVETISRYTFPAGFVIFNLLYWLFYLYLH